MNVGGRHMQRTVGSITGMTVSATVCTTRTLIQGLDSVCNGYSSAPLCASGDPLTPPSDTQRDLGRVSGELTHGVRAELDRLVVGDGGAVEHTGCS